MVQSSPDTIEIFPIELFFELSKYFEAIEFYTIFKDLNSRINSILYQIPIYLNIDGDDYDNYDPNVELGILSFINPLAIRSLHIYSNYQHVAIFEQFSLSFFRCLRSLRIDMKSIPSQVIDQISSLNYLQ